MREYHVVLLLVLGVVAVLSAVHLVVEILEWLIRTRVLALLAADVHGNALHTTVYAHT